MKLVFFMIVVLLQPFLVFSQVSKTKLFPVEKLLKDVYVEKDRNLHQLDLFKYQSAKILSSFSSRKEYGIVVEFNLKLQANTCPYDGVTYKTLNQSTSFYNFSLDKKVVDLYFAGELACSLWGKIVDEKLELIFKISHKKASGLKNLLKKTITFRHYFKAKGLRDHYVDVMYSPKTKWTISPIQQQSW